MCEVWDSSPVWWRVLWSLFVSISKHRKWLLFSGRNAFISHAIFVRKKVRFCIDLQIENLLKFLPDFVDVCLLHITSSATKRTSDEMCFIIIKLYLFIFTRCWRDYLATDEWGICVSLKVESRKAWQVAVIKVNLREFPVMAYWYCGIYLLFGVWEKNVNRGYLH